MKVAYFTERPYRWISEDEVLKNHAFFAVSNKHFDREKATDDYNYFLDEYCYAEELGFDAVALNEHHGNPFCMGGVMNVEASILARVTSKAKIVLIGNKDRMTSMRLSAEEVMPAIRECAKELDLPDPYERTPGMIKAHAGAKRTPVVDRSPLASLGLI
jgi:hypothetical protein